MIVRFCTFSKDAASRIILQKVESSELIIPRVREFVYINNDQIVGTFVVAKITHNIRSANQNPSIDILCERVN